MVICNDMQDLSGFDVVDDSFDLVADLVDATFAGDR